MTIEQGLDKWSCNLRMSFNSFRNWCNRQVTQDIYFTYPYTTEPEEDSTRNRIDYMVRMGELGYPILDKSEATGFPDCKDMPSPVGE